MDDSTHSFFVLRLYSSLFYKKSLKYLLRFNLSSVRALKASNRISFVFSACKNIQPHTRVKIFEHLSHIFPLSRFGCYEQSITHFQIFSFSLFFNSFSLFLFFSFSLFLFLEVFQQLPLNLPWNQSVGIINPFKSVILYE